MSESNGRATIREVYELLGRVEDKIDAQLAHHDLRLGSLERWRAYLAGIAVAVSTGIGFAIKYI